MLGPGVNACRSSCRVNVCTPTQWSLLREIDRVGRVGCPSVVLTKAVKASLFAALHYAYQEFIGAISLALRALVREI